MRPGLSTSAKITTATRKDAVTVPIQALTIRMKKELEEVQKSSKGKAQAAAPKPNVASAAAKESKDKGKEEIQGVFVVRGGKAVFTAVETGIMGTTDAEVLSGVKPSEEIVTGSFSVLRTLKNQTNVKVDNSGLKANQPAT
jgi:HlyD family secretion protein